MLILKAFAEATTGAAGYNRAVSRQLQRATGMTARQANAYVAANAGGRAPFQAARGQNSRNTNVMRNAQNAAARGRRG